MSMIAGGNPSTSGQTLLMLHGFSSNASDFAAKMEPLFSSDDAAAFYRVYPTAPLRRIRCYDNAWFRSWHDYLTAHGDAGEAIEEEIADLNGTIDWVLSVARRQAAKSSRPVALVGESQGACVAIAVAVAAAERYALRLPVVSLYGQRYSQTPASRAFPLYAFWSDSDAVIAPELVRGGLHGMNVRMSRAARRAAHADEQSARKFLHVALANIRREANQTFSEH